MKRQLSRFTPFSIMVYLILSTFNLADSASQPPKGNGVHFCGVTEWQPDNRRYARSFAANLNVGEPRTVRLIYFLPSDRAPEQDIDTKLDTMIKNVQKFYADEMERHGFGRKTFTFETNADGNALVHHVGGQFTSSYYSGNLNIHDLSGKVISEIADRLNRSTNMYLVAVDSGWGGGGTGGGNPSGGSALITIERERFDTSTYLTLRELGYLTAHELGHAFGLSHDFRDPVNIMAYRSGVSPQLSRCNAEWLDAHRYFNPGQVDFDISPTIRMLPPLVSPPNGTRLRFEVTDADGLHQAQLIIPSTISDPSSGVKLRGCKTLSGESDTVEFIMTDLTPNTKEIWLAVIDIHGNWTWQNFPIDVASLLPAEVAVSIPTEHLAAAVRQALGLPPSDDITEQSMLELTRLKLNPGNIVNLAGLEHARNLVWLQLPHNQVGDISPLAGLRSLANLELGYNNISDIGPFAGLTRLTILNLPDNNISAVSPLAGLTRLKILDLARNNISDIKPIAGLTDLYSLRLSDNSISDISVVAGLTKLTELYLSDNNVSDISAVAGLTNLTQLSLGGNISDIAAVARLTKLTRLILWRNNISDISAVAGLTDLTDLGLESNSITDISPVSGLTNLTGLHLANNNISDILPLVENTGLGGGDRINVWRNPLSYASINTHIPALQERGVEVFFHNRTPQKIRIVTGNNQQGSPGAALEKPFVVEVKDQNGVVFERVPITFTVTGGGGMLSETSVTTDSNGQAESTLTLGPNPGTNTVEATVPGIQDKQTFNAEGIRIPKKLEIVAGIDQEGLPGEALEKPFVVEVRDQTDKPLPGVEVTFLVTNGGGTLSVTNATTDNNGRAETTLTLGPEPGTNTVEATVTGIEEKRTFTVEGIRIPKTLEIISGVDQEGLPGDALEKPFVVEVRDQTDKPLPGVEVTFTVTAGGGTVQPEIATTDENGRAESTLTLGSTPGTNTLRVSVEGNTQAVVFLTIESARTPMFTLAIPAGAHAIHIPLAVKQINGEDAVLETVGDLYNTLGDAVSYIITVGDDGGWKTYLGNLSAGTAADAAIGDDTGLIVVMSDAKTLELAGDMLGTAGASMINIDVGNNLVGLPLKPSAGLSMISDLLVDGVGAIAVSNADGMGFHTIREPGQDGDGPIVGGVGYLVVYIGTEATSIPIVGSAWENSRAVSAAPAVAFNGTQTPVLYVEGGVIDDYDMLSRIPELRVTVKNLSTGASLDTVLGTELSTTAYSATFVELSRHAAKVGEVLEIVAHSPNPFVGVRPVPQIVVSAEEVLTSRISLPDMELYEIPSESELLANYPNPFNPETWIPYRLAQAAEVTLNIYDTNGRLVRTIDIGFKPAAVYESRASAIYWDGRNDYGEQAASGVYFYHLSADDYSTTRKMLILK